MAVTASQELQDQYAARQAESEGKVNDMFDKQFTSQKQSLETAYNQNLSDQEAAKERIAPTYQTSANDLAVQYERNRRNLNMQALANGLNTGTGSQQQLALNQGFMKNYGKLRGEEAQAQTEADRQITNLKVNYQNQIAQAIADNDYKRAAALMDEFNNNRNWYDTQTRYEQQDNEAKAQTLASYGDFSGYAAMYGQDIANVMKQMWINQNPQLAWQAGLIDDATYRRWLDGPQSGGVGGGGGYYGGGSGTGDSNKNYVAKDKAAAVSAAKAIGAGVSSGSSLGSYLKSGH